MKESATGSTVNSSAISAAAALRFVILLGVVSLLADVTYEGARGITGPYLAVLGASGAVVGITAGLGELAGYGLRLFSGFLSDRTRRYWTFTIVGYAVNLAAVPMLALAGRWETAVFLIIAERAGKAIRTPARDVMLSQAAGRIGHGFGFGLHEALDQIGAILGPLVVAAVLFFKGGYRAGFAVLLLPAVAALLVLAAARRQYPRPRDFEISPAAGEGTGGFPLRFWIFIAAAALTAAGYADFALIAYHFKKSNFAPDVWIPVFYSAAMAADALAAIGFGRLFDRKGMSVLAGGAFLSAFFAPLVFLGGRGAAFLGTVLWGIGMGIQESILRAAVAGMAPVSKRGTAYGIFNFGYGLFWFLGSALMGFFYDVSLPALVVFSAGIQFASIPLFLLAGRRRSFPVVR